MGENEMWTDITRDSPFWRLKIPCLPDETCSLRRSRDFGMLNLEEMKPEKNLQGFSNKGSAVEEFS